MKTVNRVIYTSILIVGTLTASTAMACTTDAWNGGVSGSPLAGSPTTVSRVSGICAMKLSEAGSVKDISPANESTAIMRFYVRAQLSAGTPVIFEAFSDDGASSSLLTVSFDGANFVFDAGLGASQNVPGKSGWNLVELAWTGGSAMDYWVNADSTIEAATGSVAAAAGTMESVILGSSDVYTGTLTFDDYESHRSTPVGGLLMGDSNGNGSINVFDLISIQNDILGNALAVGQPDCNLNGSVNVFDLICVQNIILGN
jgi:hypothetical protein